MTYVASDAKITLVIPTAINMVLAANENIIDNLRKQQPAEITEMSVYKRAYLVTNETDEMVVMRRTGKA